jgi:hypothetical protein
MVLLAFPIVHRFGEHNVGYRAFTIEANGASPLRLGSPARRGQRPGGGVVLERNGCSEFASGIAEQLVCVDHVEQVRTGAESRRRRDQSVATALLVDLARTLVCAAQCRATNQGVSWARTAELLRQRMVAGHARWLPRLDHPPWTQPQRGPPQALRRS